MPPVIALIMLGIVLGPSGLKFATSETLIKGIANIGALFLLFEAGLETDIKRIKTDSKVAILPASIGVILPLILGFFFNYFFTHNVMQSLIIGVIFTATSVSISVITLMEIGKMSTLEGRTIVNAAILDDIFGILLLSVVFGLAGVGDGGTTLLLFGKMILFFLIIIVIGIFIIKNIFRNLEKLKISDTFLTIAISFIFLYSWMAEFSGLAAITGAYFAGLFLGQTDYKEKIHHGISVVGKSFFIDIFFVSIGLEFILSDIKASPVYLTGFIILALIGKFFGCGIGARLSSFDLIKSARIGIGMIPRGEVGIIIASMAIQKGMISADGFSATILMVVVTAIIPPILLRYSYEKFKDKSF